MTEPTFKGVPVYWVTAKRAKLMFDIDRDMLERFVKAGLLKKRRLSRKKVLYDSRQLNKLIDEHQT